MQKGKQLQNFICISTSFSQSLCSFHQKLVLPVSTIFILFLLYVLRHTELRALAQPAATGA